MTSHLSHPPILALGYSEAAMFLRTPAGATVRALISIHGANEHGVEAEMPRLDLTFDDIAAPDPADIVASYQARMRQQADAENGVFRRPPTPEDAEKIIRFAESTCHLEGMLLCHCGGGISRAPAAALLCLAVWTGPGAEVYCVDYMRKLRAGAFPHDDLIRFGDQILGRGGRLVEALRFAVNKR